MSFYIRLTWAVYVPSSIFGWKKRNHSRNAFYNFSCHSNSCLSLCWIKCYNTSQYYYHLLSAIDAQMLRLSIDIKSMGYELVEDPTVTVRCRIAIKAMFLYFNLCPCVMLDSLSYSIASMSFLTTRCCFTLICI